MKIKLIGEAPKKEVFRCPVCGKMIEIWHIGDKVTRLYGIVSEKGNFECLNCGAILSLEWHGEKK